MFFCALCGKAGATVRIDITEHNKTVSRDICKMCDSNLTQAMTKTARKDDNKKPMIEMRLRKNKPKVKRVIDANKSHPCNTCGKLKPATVEYFSRRSDRRDTLRSYCKKCANETLSERTKEKRRLRKKKTSTAESSTPIQTTLASKTCVRCKQTLSVSEFTRYNPKKPHAGYDGYQEWCTKCLREYSALKKLSCKQCRKHKRCDNCTRQKCTCPLQRHSKLSPFNNKITTTPKPTTDLGDVLTLLDALTKKLMGIDKQ